MYIFENKIVYDSQEKTIVSFAVVAGPQIPISIYIDFCRGPLVCYIVIYDHFSYIVLVDIETLGPQLSEVRL